MEIYITFGQAHTHSVNGKTFDKDCVAKIKAKDMAEGRKKAFEIFGNKFAFIYDSAKVRTDFMSFFPRGIIEL